MAEGKKSILFYVDWGETFNALTDEQAGKLVKHLCAYVNDENPETDDPLIKAVFVNIKQQLKRDLVKYEDKCLKNKENGKKGGRPKKETERLIKKPNGLLENPTKAKKPDTDTDTDTDILINNISSSEFRERTIKYLNIKLKTKFRDNTNQTIKDLEKIWKEKYTLNDIKKVLDYKINEWKEDTEMKKYLVPSTLFRFSNFEKYLESASNYIEVKPAQWTNDPRSGQFC